MAFSPLNRRSPDSPAAAPPSSSQAAQIPLRLVLIVPFLVQVFGIVGLVGFLSFRNGQQAVSTLAHQLGEEISLRIDQHLDSYLDIPKTINRANSELIELGLLDLTNFDQVGQHFWRQVKLYHVNFLQFGTPNGEYIGAGDYGDGSVRIEEVPYGKVRESSVYEVDSQGHRRQVLDITDFDPREESWFTLAETTHKPGWGAIYNWDGNPQIISVAAAQPVFDRQGKFIGAMGIDLNLTNISQFLKQLKIGKSGKAFIVERSGLLVASSIDEPPFVMLGDVAERLNATESRDPTIRSVARFLREQFGDWQTVNTPQQLSMTIAGEGQHVLVSPWHDDLGLDWLVILVVPESDFMAQITKNTHTTILLCLAALVGSTVLGIYTSRWITRPILHLKRASQAIAAGQLNQTVEVKGIEELETLGHAFNQMAMQLQTSFDELETRVAARTKELRQAKDTADQANRAKSEFLANMSHELRTPLNGILGYAQILQRDTSLNPKQRDSISIIYQCGSHLLTLINDILDLSKIEAQKFELLPKDFLLQPFLSGIVELCRIRAEQKDITFIYETVNQLPLAVHADEKRLRQVLINLLGNAIKFTDQGTVTFKVGVLAQADPKLVYLRFQVEDTGIGMMTSQLKTIFQPFVQIGDKQRMAEGTGLGLAISQQIVQMMGSQLRVESELGQGSRFWFDVKLLEAQDLKLSTESPTQNIVVGYRGTQRTVLVVDDRWENRSVIANMLTSLGFVVVEAVDGLDGMNQAQRHHPDVIITDLAMPVMDGFELTRQIRRCDTLKQTVVIASSASVFSFNRQQSQEAGCNGFLPKPVQTDELLDQLRQHLQLTWLYADPAIAPTHPSPLITSPAWVMPPTEDLRSLYQAIRIGDVEGAEQVVQSLKTRSPQYSAFVDRVQHLLDGFELDELLLLLKPYFLD